MKIPIKTSVARGRELHAFSLLEVMVAIGVFFLGVFAILGLVSSSLANARRLQRPIVDAGLVASEVSLTNKLTEGTFSGDLSEFLGKSCQGYTWTYTVDEIDSNKLFGVTIILQDEAHGRAVVSQMNLHLFRPESPPGHLDGGMGR
jgi:hypothetical protein